MEGELAACREKSTNTDGKSGECGHDATNGLGVRKASGADSTCHADERDRRSRRDLVEKPSAGAARRRAGEQHSVDHGTDQEADANPDCADPRQQDQRRRNPRQPVQHSRPKDGGGVADRIEVTGGRNRDRP
jgi:hypothetical protein